MLRERLKTLLELAIFYIVFQRVEVVERIVSLWRRTIGRLISRRRHPLSYRHHPTVQLGKRKKRQLLSLQETCLEVLVEDIDLIDESSMYHLSPDMAQMLFDKLSKKRQLNIDIINIFSHQFLYRVDFGNQKSATDTWLTAILTPGIRFLDISYGGMISNEGLRSIKNYNMLQSLSLNFCNEMLDSTFESLAGLTQLTKLSLKGCNHIRGTGLKYISSLVNLEVLDLELCRELERGLQYLKNFVRLSDLNLGWCSKLSHINRKYILPLKNLVKLDVSQTKLADIIDVKCAYFPSLKDLSLSGGVLYNEGLAHLPKLCCLEQLDLDHCCFPQQSIKFISSMTSLKKLNIGFTKIKNRQLSHISCCTNLTHLNADSLVISNRGLSFLSTLQKLRFLNLADTRIGNSSMHVIVSLTTLEVLHLACTEVTNDGLRRISSLSNLTELNLDSRLFGDEAIKHITTLINLKKLDMFGAKLSDEGICGLENCYNIENLELCGGLLSDKCFGTLSQLTLLTHLSVAQNSEISCPKVEELNNLRDLQSLNLSGTSVRGQVIVNLTGMKNLLCLSLYDTNVTNLAAQKLKESLSQLQILGKK